MQIFYTQKALAEALAPFRSQAQSIGLVPTMGALHAGHLSLVQRALEENTVCVVSIFVNPTQFNNPQDLATYPRTLEADCDLLDAAAAKQPAKSLFVFAPSVEEVYPEPDTRTFSYPPIDTVMEGARRPGHFNGVCQIVSKLFLLTAPDRAYFGEKDFQQIAVVRAMTQDLKLPLEIVPCPIVREPSGLALSSRNTLLTDAERAVAAKIYATLRRCTALRAEGCSVEKVKACTIAEIEKEEALQVEYFAIVDPLTLQDLNAWDGEKPARGCITVFCGARPVRLIDNVPI